MCWLVREHRRHSGTIQYLPFEGGFYGIVEDDLRKYDPVNLESQFAVDGL